MSLDDELAQTFEALVQERGYDNRSEAFRDLLRAEMGRTRLQASPDNPCIATLSFVYDHHQRQLAMRLTDMQHAHHDLTIASTHVHLDRDQCVEVVILRGAVKEVQDFAQTIMTQPGVSHSSLHVVPMP